MSTAKPKAEAFELQAEPLYEWNHEEERFPQQKELAELERNKLHEEIQARFNSELKRVLTW